MQREGFGFSVNSVTSASSCVTRTVELVAAGCVVSGASVVTQGENENGQLPSARNSSQIPMLVLHCPEVL